MKPYIFQLPDWLPLAGGRPIFSYGVMLGLSYILGWSLVVHFCRRDGIDGKIASAGMFVIVVSSLLGARAMHFISSPTAELTLANFIKFDEGGLVVYGGMVTALACSWFYMWWHGVDGWVYWDNSAPAVALGFGITRVGCFLFGCDYGTRSESALALRFPRWEDPEVALWIKRSAPAYVDHFRAVAEPVAQFSHSVHPTQLYESLVGFVAFAVLILWLPLKRFHGQIMMVFVVYYGLARYGLEVIRGDADRGENVFLWLSTSQLISALLLGTAAFIWWILSKRGLYAAAGTSAWNPAVISGRRKPKKRKGKKRG